MWLRGKLGVKGERGGGGGYKGADEPPPKFFLPQKFILGESWWKVCRYIKDWFKTIFPV